MKFFVVHAMLLSASKVIPHVNAASPAIETTWLLLPFRSWTEWASSSFRTDARLKQRGFVVVVEIVVDIAAAAETREDPSSSQK